MYVINNETLFHTVFRLAFKNIRSLQYYGVDSWETMYDILTGPFSTLRFGEDIQDRIVDLLEPQDQYTNRCYGELVYEIFQELV